MLPYTVTLVRTLCNFNQAQDSIPDDGSYDPKHVAVNFNVCFLDFNNTDFNIYNCIKCVSVG
jgi:hypothetical protein